MRRISCRTAWRKFSDIVLAVAQTRQPIEITRYNRVIARIVPADSAVQPAHTIFEHAATAENTEQSVTQPLHNNYSRNNLSLETATGYST